MAVTGIFTADFSNFNSEVKKAETSLKSFEGSSAKVETQFKEMGDAADKSAPQINTARESVRQFDGVLSTMGVNVNKQAEAFDDLSRMAGKTVSQVGFLGSAAAMAGAAMAGWETGRAIAGLLKTDEAITKLTASMMGWTTVAEQTALAENDVKRKAFEMGAAWDVNIKEAREFIAVEEERKAALIDWGAKMDDAKASLKDLTREQIDGIEAGIKMGATQKQLTLQYGISKDALKFFDAETDSSSEKLKRNEDQLARLAQQLERNKQKRDDATDATVKHSSAATSNAKAIDENADAEQHWREEMEKTKAFLDAREVSLTSIKTKAEEAKAANDAFMKAPTLNNREAQSITSDIPRLTGFALDAVKARFHQAGDDSDNAALWRGLDTLEAMEGRYNVTDNASFFAMQRDTLLLAQLRMLLQGGQRVPSFASGVENFAGGLAYVHGGEQLVNLPPGTDVRPAGRGAGGTVNNITLHLSGVIGSKQEIGNYLSEILVDRFRSFGYRGPVPFGA